MRIAHLGPPPGRSGGPTGYLLQLARALDGQDTRGHQVLLPQGPPVAARGAASRERRLLVLARRLRRTLLGPPAFGRPPADDLPRAGGHLGRMLDESWAGVVAEVEPSLAAAAGADVIFAHDAPSAEAALERRAAGQQVWLLQHNPMPLALYLAWSFGVPERPWEEIREYPDVRSRMDRERSVLEAVDRVFIPVPEAATGLARVDAGIGAAMARAGHLMTGASGPALARPGASRAALRAVFGLPVSEPVGLFLGNAQPYRGLDCLRDALGAMPSRRALPGVVAVAGVGAGDLPLQSRLVALGRVAEVGDLLAAVDFVINVNRFSLFDLSLIEAAEAGRALLLHDTGGNAAFARLGAGTTMLPSLDARAVASGLEALFSTAAPDLEARGARSRACHERHLTLAHLRARHLDLYDEAAGRRASA
ncbi:MAG: hypothetical protein AB7H88_21635 [Vicinamibacterales bacterium]